MSKHFFLIFLVPITTVFAELPAIFRGAPSGKDPIIRDVTTPTQEKLRENEESFREVLAGRPLAKSTLQGILIDAIEARLRGQLDEAFFKRASISETDQTFLREFLTRIHLYRSERDGIFLKQGDRVFQGKRLTPRLYTQIHSPTEEEALNGKVMTYEYGVKLELQTAREWNAGKWSEWSAEILVGEFRLLVIPFQNEREKILNDGKLPVKAIMDLSLSPISVAGLPRGTVNTFSILSSISHLSGAARFEALEKLSNANDTEAQFLLGYAYEVGLNGPRNLEKADDLYSKAAVKKFPASFYRLGLIYLDRPHEGMDFTVASHYFKEAAELGHVGALGMRGWFLLLGRGESRDVTQGIEYLDYAASRSDPFSLTKLGEIIRERMVWSDEEKAETSVDEQVKTFYLNSGRSIPKPEELFLRAAKNRHAGAACRLGDKEHAPTPSRRLKWLLLALKWSNETSYYRNFESGVDAVEKINEAVKEMSEEEIKKALEEAMSEDLEITLTRGTASRDLPELSEQ